MSAAVLPNPEVRVVPDSFKDDLFAPLDLRTGPTHFADSLSTIAEDEPDFAPTPEEILAADGVPPQPDTPAPSAPPAPAAPAQPEVSTFDDGSTLTVEKTSKGWQAVLAIGGGAGKEVFYGRTKDEMWQKVAEGKINATKKIRKMNRQIKLGPPAAAAPAPSAPPAPAVRKLDANDLFEVKTALADNPEKAFDAFFQKKYGLTTDELVKLARDGAKAGKQAQVTLEGESVARAFLEQHQGDYFSCDENYNAIVAYLAKHRLGKGVNANNFDAIVHELGESGNWTLDNLNEAFEELSDDGLLQTEPDEDPVTPAPAPPAPPAPAPVPPTPLSTSPRIVSERRQPRAGMGIRQREVTSATPKSTEPQPVEDLENLNDDEIAKLFAGVRQHAASGRR